MTAANLDLLVKRYPIINSQWEVNYTNFNLTNHIIEDYKRSVNLGYNNLKCIVGNEVIGNGFMIYGLHKFIDEYMIRTGCLYSNIDPWGREFPVWDGELKKYGDKEGPSKNNLLEIIRMEFRLLEVDSKLGSKYDVCCVRLTSVGGKLVYCLDRF